MTGLPVKRHDVDPSKKDFLLPRIEYYTQKNYPMTSRCCRGGTGVETSSTFGLISGHVYTLLDIVQLEGGPTLAKLRNPWSKERYIGPWSDDDSRWTDAWRQ